MMKPSMKMGVIALIGVCVVFYQYHLSTGVRFDQVSDFNGVGSAEDAGNLPLNNQIDYVESPRINEKIIRRAVQRVQKASGLSPDIASILTLELVNQLRKSDVEHSENASGDGRATTTGVMQDPANVHVVQCHPSPSSSASFSSKIEDSFDPLYIITPTYRRPEQIPELTRMSHTLMLVKNVHWLVIEDAMTQTEQVTKLLQRTGLKFEHLVAPMPPSFKSKKGAKPRGVSNRNRGLQWIRANATKGVFYFADDDNTYDILLFDEIRKTKRVSMFPVGLCTKFGLSSPIIKNGKFVGFYDGWIAGRKFPVDMAGFAVNVKFLLERPNATMPYRAGFEEDGFLKSLEPLEPREIEFLADNCTKILAWHTQTKRNEPSAPLDAKYSSTNLVKLKQQIV